jgi:hypothetical protein
LIEVHITVKPGAIAFGGTGRARMIVTFHFVQGVLEVIF